MASGHPVCLSSDSPPPEDASDDSGAEEQGSVNSTFLATVALIFPDDFSGCGSVLSSVDQSLSSAIPGPSRVSSCSSPPDSLAIERLTLEERSCSSEVARKPSTLRSYRKHWRSFYAWCVSKGFDVSSIYSFQVLYFLRDGFMKGLAPSTLSAPWSAIKALPNREEFFKLAPLVARLLRSFRLQKLWHRLLFRLGIFLWSLRGCRSLLLILCLRQTCYGYLLRLPFWWQLLWLNELGALLSSAPYLRFYPDPDHVLLKLDPKFVPKVDLKFHPSQEMVLPVFSEGKSSVPSSLVVRRALVTYLDRTKDFGVSPSLFLSYGSLNKRKKSLLSNH